MNSVKFKSDNSGGIAISKLDVTGLKMVSMAGGGRYTNLTIDDTDINILLTEDVNATTKPGESIFTDHWQEEGPWILLFLVPLAALSFRRGWVGVFLLFFLPLPESLYAFSWDDLWKTKNQQAQEALKDGNNKKAAELFEDPLWKAVSLYKLGEYSESALKFSEYTDADNLYNFGNSLARMGEFASALNAYEHVLNINSDDEDTKFNYDLIKKLMESNQSQDNQGEEKNNNSQEGIGDQDSEPADASDEDSAVSKNNGEEGSDGALRDQEQNEDDLAAIEDELEKNDFEFALLLGLAYAASMGGMSTLVGTAPNAMMAAFMLDTYSIEIDFSRWMLVGIPLTLVMVPLAWLTLTRIIFKVDFKTGYKGQEKLKQMKEEMGKISLPEKKVGIVFIVLALTWILRPLLTNIPGLSALDDSGIEMAGALAIFLIPSGDKNDPFLLRWVHIEKLPWSILLLFGGGLSLASAVSKTGLAKWLGVNLVDIGTLPLVAIVVLITAMIIFLTELTSNIATTATFLPVVGAIAVEMGINPIILVAPIPLAASCAFMLPVATPPNAIVFGSGLLTIPKMMRAGLLLNIIGIVIVSIVAITLAPKFLNG